MLNRSMDCLMPKEVTLGLSSGGTWNPMISYINKLINIDVFNWLLTMEWFSRDRNFGCPTDSATPRYLPRSRGSSPLGGKQR